MSRRLVGTTATTSSSSSTIKIIHGPRRSKHDAVDIPFVANGLKGAIVRGRSPPSFAGSKFGVIIIHGSDGQKGQFRRGLSGIATRILHASIQSVGQVTPVQGRALVAAEKESQLENSIALGSSRAALSQQRQVGNVRGGTTLLTRVEG